MRAISLSLDAVFWAGHLTLMPQPGHCSIGVLRVPLSDSLVETGFEEAFFRDGARRIKNAVDVPVALIGGVTKLSLVEGALREGFACVQVRRRHCFEPFLTCF